MFQSKAESGPYTLWYKFDDDAIRRRFTPKEYARASADLAQGAAQVARCYLDVVTRDEAAAVGGEVATAWVALNWEAPGVLQGFELRRDRTALLPREWVAQEVFWTVLDRRARGEDRRIFFEWLRVALLAVRSDTLGQDPFAGWFGGADPVRAVVKLLWARMGDVLNVSAGLSPEGKGQAPNGHAIEVRCGDAPDSFQLGGPDLPWRTVPRWGIDLLAWQTFRDLLLEAAEKAEANPPPPPPPPSPALLVVPPRADPPRADPPRAATPSVAAPPSSVTPMAATVGLKPCGYRVVLPCEIPGSFKAIPLKVGTYLEAAGIQAIYRGHTPSGERGETRINDACLQHLISCGFVRPEYATPEATSRALLDELLK